MSELYIPRKTLDEIAASHPEGTRHQAMIRVAMSMLGNHASEAAVFALLRATFDAEKTDSEIHGVIRWCSSRCPLPSVPTNGARMPASAFSSQSRNGSTPTPAPKKSTEDASRECALLAEDFVDSDLLSVETMTSRSPVPVGDFGVHGELYLRSLYQPEDMLNIVCKYTVNEKGKANPSGGGRTLKRDEWLDWFSKNGVPFSEAGAWLRPNPCGPGSGHSGAITDADILKFEFLLLESDILSTELQVSIYAKLPIPIVSLMSSGGKSIHALALIRAPDAATYTNRVLRILKALKPIGFDESNKNPSRLSRLPGVSRSIQAFNGGKQELLYLNPSLEPVIDDQIESLEQLLTPPFISKSPMKRTARTTIDRYEDLHKHRGATGLRTGIATFDSSSGGLKRGSLVVVAGHTGGGKTTLAINILNRALHDKKAVALFTLEMDESEIVDMLIALNFGVDRNVFNTGNFSEKDFQLITHGITELKTWPLYVFDNPNTDSESIRETCLKLKAKGVLDLIVVDYLQLVSPPLAFKESREQQIAFIGRSMKKLAKECKVPVIAVSQLNEEGKLRESRAIAHEANIVFILDEAQSETELTLRITKGRSVRKGNFTMNFDPIHCKLTEQPKVMPDYVTR